MPQAELKYQSGFGNEFATEAVKGALPEGQNSCLLYTSKSRSCTGG